ncbi:MAG: lactonase family protein [Bacteroidales bacterium]|nr:lactonase family protein [Bacteroidales bacterium]
MTRLLPLSAAAALILGACSSSSKPKEEALQWLIVGSYAPADSAGIKVYAFNPSTLEASLTSGMVGISNPSFLALNADATRLYSVGEDNGLESTANALTFDTATGEMEWMNSQPTGGGAPCYIVLSPQATTVATANYMGGNLSVFPLDEQGALLPPQVVTFEGVGSDDPRQQQPHIHCISYTPDGRYMLATDLGTDRIHCLSLDANDHPVDSTLSDIAIKSHSGPRHLVWSADGAHAYLVNEIGGTVVTLDYADGVLTPRQYVVIDSVGAEGSGDIRLSPDGRHLYASNRLKADGVAIMEVGPDGLLTHIGYQPTGPHPRNFILTPDGRYVLVAVRDADAIEIYERNSSTGLLTPTGKSISTPRPVCLLLTPCQ